MRVIVVSLKFSRGEKIGNSKSEIQGFFTVLRMTT
jgi:hypothetical protein